MGTWAEGISSQMERHRPIPSLLGGTGGHRLTVGGVGLDIQGKTSKTDLNYSGAQAGGLGKEQLNVSI